MCEIAHRTLTTGLAQAVWAIVSAKMLHLPRFTMVPNCRL